MLSYNRVRVIGICPLLPALHAGSVNIDMMPDYSNSCFKERVHGGCGWDAFISHLCLCVSVLCKCFCYSFVRHHLPSAVLCIIGD